MGGRRRRPGGATVTSPREAPPRWLGFVAVALFLVYAANFLYFFVDDEGIPYVYAQNVLNGHGLSYNVLEGRVEGYSDFLHVWVCTIVLAFVRALHLSKITVFFVGKGVSLAAGAAVVATIWALLGRLRIARAGAVTGLSVVVLAGPLALWSCSSLETVPFTLALLVCIWGLVTRRDGMTLAGAALVVLYRIDGFVYVGALLGAFLIFDDPARRGRMIRAVVLPLVGLFGVYHAWRIWYFGDPFPTPLEAKVLYKFTRQANLLVKAPDVPYWIRFARVVGWPAVAGLILAGVHALRIGRVPRALAVATIPIVLYVSVVGDWMFGFRFFVAVLPLFALIAALSVGELAVRQPRAAAVVALASVVWMALAGARFVHEYREAESAEPFLTNPSRDPHRFFHPYYGLYETARHLIPPGATVAYNQAGFVPFMLNLTNIDDLGICSKFYAELPTTDVFFTEVGRYAPLSNRRAIGAAHAYLLHENVQFVISRTDLLRGANDNQLPRSLLGGYYELVATDPSGDNAVYRRTDWPAGRYATDPSAFYENLAHVSHLRQVSIDGIAVPSAEFGSRLPFLRERRGLLSFNRSLTLNAVFSSRDVRVSELSIERIDADRPITLTMELWSAAAGLVARRRIEVGGGPQAVQEGIPGGVGANRIVLQFTSDSGEETRAWVDDLRVQGQTQALHDYIERKLRFSVASGSGGKF